MTEPFVRPDVQALLAFLANAPSPKIHEVDAATARTMMMTSRMLLDADPVALPVIRDLSIPGPKGDIRARLYDARESREPGPVMVFFHGGGFVIGDLETHEPYCTRAAQMLDLPVVAIDYALAPEHPWPAAPDDCEAAARWVATSPSVLGRTVTSLVLSGDSAGGALTVITTMSLRDRPAAVPVIAQFPIYPATDMTRAYPSNALFADGYMLTAASMAWFDGHYGAEADDVRTSPLLGNHEAMPPTLVLTASLDPLRDQGRAYAAALIAAGVQTLYREAAGNIHGFINLAKGVPSSVGDIAGALAALAPVIAEAEANRVMAQASGAGIARDKGGARAA